MEDKCSDRTSNRTSVIFIGEGFLVPTFRYLPSSVGRCNIVLLSFKTKIDVPIFLH